MGLVVLLRDVARMGFQGIRVGCRYIKTSDMELLGMLIPHLRGCALNLNKP